MTKTAEKSIIDQVDIAYNLGLKANEKVSSFARVAFDKVLIVFGFLMALGFFIYGFLNFRSKKNDK